MRHGVLLFWPGERLPAERTDNLDLSGNFRKDQIEHNVGHGQGQNQIEALATDIEEQRLATFEILGQLTKIGGETNSCKGEGKEPSAKQTGTATDNALVNHRST